MFEFGRDLRKLFAQARESEDLGWVELIGPDLLRAEALRESIDAGRVSCNRPFETEHRAAALWRTTVSSTPRNACSRTISSGGIAPACAAYAST